MSNLFYRAFEDKFRGSRSLIISRLNVYREFISPLKDIHNDAQGIDLGCGRGEWLEVLKSESINPLGIDLDEGMLQACTSIGLPAIKGDAIAYLEGLPSESQSVVSAFHVVEHVAFEQLQTIISEALRVLKPGGLLILETPNPENIEVGTANFYLDPTHERPIPPLLLSFLPEHLGFTRIKVLRLQEPPELIDGKISGIHQLIRGVSPDYAVVAQKNAPVAVLEKFASAFSKNYGISLADLCARYDQGINEPFINLIKRFARIESIIELKTQTLEYRIHRAEKAAEISEMKLLTAIRSAEAELLRKTENNFFQVELHAQALHHSLVKIQSSTFWRLTAPMRWATLQIKLLWRYGLRSRVKSLQNKMWPMVAITSISDAGIHVESPLPPLPVVEQTIQSSRVNKVYSDLVIAMNNNQK